MTCLYLVIFSLYSLMTRFIWTAGMIDGTINTLFYRGILVLGCLLAGWWFLAERKLFLTKKPSPDFLLLGSFVVVLGISTLLNYSYNLTDNLYGVLTFLFELVLFYLMGRTLSADDWNTIIKRVVLSCSLLWDAACAGSLLQFFLDMSYTTIYAEDHGAVRQGLMDGRLFGLFSDPNFAAFTSLLLLIGMWHIRPHVKYTATRFFIWLSIVLNTVYIIMSNSRTVYLSVVGSITFYVLLRCYKKYQAEGITGAKMLRILCSRFLLTLILLTAAYFAILIPLRGFTSLVSPERNVAAEMVREDVNEENISNNRFTIWRAYLELYTEKPIFGFSTRSALPYVSAEHPDSYLAETQYVTHNGYISLLVETGAVGFLVMASFVIMLIVRSARRIADHRALADTYYVFAAWLVSILMFCLCFHDIFFTLNLETMLFFCGLGFLWQNK